MTSRKRKRSCSRQNQDPFIPEGIERNETTEKLMRAAISCLAIVFICIGAGSELYFYLMRHLERSECQYFLGQDRTPRPRPTWKTENERISDRMFFPYEQALFQSTMCEN